MKIISIVGARPQFVKLAPLSRKLRERHQEIIVHSGQHYSDAMSAALFTDLNLPAPDYNLGVGSARHGEQTGRMLAGIEQVLVEEGGDLVLVFGDTNTTLAGALAAVKLHLPVLHIEAGLRSHNRRMPEEINRLATDHIAEYLFAPTKTAMANLERENLLARSWLTGDIMADALRENSQRALTASTVLARHQLSPDGYYLLTLHRPYTVDSVQTLHHVLQELQELDQPVVFPVHPRTAQVLHDCAIAASSRLLLLPPQGYLDFICLASQARAIVTDSGGIQKEAYLLKKPCITLRSETEWVETVAAGWNLLVDPASCELAEKIIAFQPEKAGPDIFGRDVADLMVRTIEQLLTRH